MYTLSISIGIEGGIVGGVSGGVGRYAFIGEGVCWVNLLVQYVFRLVRMAWCVHVDLIQASQLWGSL